MTWYTSTFYSGLNYKKCRPGADTFCGRPPDLSPNELKIGTPITSDLGNVHFT